jgi:hypothetical protein
MPHVDLDISNESPHVENQKWALSHGCDCKLLARHGPAGGNPLYRFYGTRAQLTALIHDFVPGANHDHLISHIVD